MSLPVERIRDEHPYGPLYRAYAAAKQAERRGDTRSIHRTRKALGAVRHDLLRGGS